MGQKCNPISNRLGIIRGWDSNWFGGKNYGDKLVEDYKIRKYLNARLAKAGIAKIVIERTLKLITITINTARPGIIIGKGGQEVDKLKEELKKITDKEVQINIFEIKRPELDYEKLAEVDEKRPELAFDVQEQVNIEIKYEGYIKRQMQQVAQFKKLEGRKLPENFDYAQVNSLRKEAVQKLNKIQPSTIGQASRISGVSPADISVLMVYLERSKSEA